MSRAPDSRQRSQWQGRSGIGSTASGPSSPALGPLQRATEPSTAAGSTSDDGTPKLPQAYALEPPSFRPYLHPYAAGLGTPDFYPATSDLPEFTLSPQVMREGLQSKSQIGSEAFSIHNMIYERLSTPGVLSTLTALLHNVVHLRLPSHGCPPSAAASGVSLHSFRLPNRVTLNDLKLGNYIRQLADPSVPLHRLARSVPHGSKGERLLDMLWLGAPPPAQQNSAYSAMGAHGLRIPGAASASNLGAGAASSTAPVTIPASVPIERAVWFIRVVGASDIQSARNRSTNYTVEWTATVTAWLQKQLQELAVPPEAKAATLPTITRGQTLHSTSPITSSVPGALSSPITAAVTSPSSGPSSPVQTRGFGQASFGRSSLWHANSGLASADSAAAITAASLGRSTRVLMQPALLPRWISKWTYGLALLRALLAQQLLDTRTLFTWLAESFKSADITQSAVLLFLVEEALEDMLRSGPPLRAGLPILKHEAKTWWPQLANGLCDRLQTFVKQLAALESSSDEISDFFSTIGLREQKDDDPVSDIYRFTCTGIRDIIVLAFDLQPSLFLHPGSWANHATVLSQIILAEDPNEQRRPGIGRLSKNHLQQRRADFAILQGKCDRLLNGPTFDGVVPAEAHTAFYLREVLRSLDTCSSGSADYDKIFLQVFGFRKQGRDFAAEDLYPCVKLLLTWACRTDAEHLDSLQAAAFAHNDPFEHCSVDSHRPFVAIRLLAQLAGVDATESNLESRAGGRSSKTTYVSAADIHLLLMRWLSEVDESQRSAPHADLGTRHPSSKAAPARSDSSNLGVSLLFVHFERILTIFTELEMLGIFSFSKYIQRMTARGLILRQVPGTQYQIQPSSKQNSAKHSDNSLFGRLLRSLPIHHATAAQLKTRRLAIYGPRDTESREEAMERRASRELRSSFGWLFEPRTVGQDQARRSGSVMDSTEVVESLNDMELPPVASDSQQEPRLKSDDEADEMEALFSDDAESEYDVDRRLLRELVSPRLERHAVSEPAFASAEQLMELAKLFLVTADFANLARVVELGLRSADSVDAMRVACDLLVVHISVWRAIGVLEQLLNTVQAASRRISELDFTALFMLSASLDVSSAVDARASITTRATSAFVLTQSAWACVRLGALDPSRFAEAFQHTPFLDASAEDRSAAVSWKSHFDDLFQTQAGKTTEASTTLTHPMDDRDEREAARFLLIGALRHMRTASVQNATLIVEHLTQCCRSHMMTLDEQATNQGQQLWSTGDVEDASDWPALGQGRVSFRAHQKFIEELVGNGCVSAEVALKSMLLPHLKSFARGANLTEDIVGRTALATALSFLQVALLPSSAAAQSLTSIASSRMAAERTLLLQPRCVPLLARTFVSLQLGGKRAARPDISDSGSKFSRACASLAAALQADPQFRSAVAKVHSAFIAVCREEMDGIDASDRSLILLDVATLVGTFDIDPHKDDPGLSQKCLQAFDALTALRSVAELALAVESASSQGSATWKTLPMLQSIALLSYPNICLRWSGELAEHAFTTANSSSLLSTLLEAALLRIKSQWSGLPDQASHLLAGARSIGQLLRRSIPFTVPVHCGPITDALVPLIEQRLLQLNQNLGSDEGVERRTDLMATLALLRQIIRTSSFWTPLARQKGPQLLKTLINLAVDVAIDDVLLEDTLGSIDLLISELPSDAQTKAAVNSVLSGTSDSSGRSKEQDVFPNLPLPSSVENRIYQRLPILNSDLIGEGLLFGSTASSASVHHRFSIQPNKVWDHLEFIPQPEGGRAGTTSATTPRLDAKAISDSTNAASLAKIEAITGPSLVWLNNAGSLSLGDFGAKRTKDLITVPADSAGASSELSGFRTSARVLPEACPVAERTYGDGVGGEPIIARDLQSGAVNPSVEKRARSSMILRIPHLSFPDDELRDDSQLSSSGDEDHGEEEETASQARSRNSSARSSLAEREGGSRVGGSLLASSRKRKRQGEGGRGDTDGEAASSGLSDAPTPAGDEAPASSPMSDDTPTQHLPGRSASGGPRRGRSVRGRLSRGRN
ncbi:unnamed protein product [Tilletia controversa]|uniref:Mediator of RNA polymerase II transcription subunit 12 n=1 Tax=Tilletia caries TaxID=13290 RepID=A0ABN7JC33_9BASI|nr:unnamed protein product [Tilletia caries]CAD6903249.1 unnamed protein product [Tilletia controversa]CAD6910875.1 unnamed protein product [Tilletia caries]CAD6941462.1 unnamed protein product [Tilletia controversa]CAD6959578.1 unnamed protein product [Tilletia caries]